MGINRVVISGNLTRDPDLRSTAGGMSVLSFGVAVNDRRKNAQTGEWEDYPNFLDCTVFGARADALNNILKKGSKVAIEGRLRWSQWEKDGQKRSKVEIIVDNLDFMSSRGNNGGYNSATSASNPGSYSSSSNYNGGNAVNTGANLDAVSGVDTGASAYGEEIPF